MARYRKHYISYGDTIQSIAHVTTGSVAGWRDIVRHNNLKYPYIVDSVEEKLESPEHLVTYGDHLIIPVESSLEDVNPYALNLGDQDTIYDMTLGIDLNILEEDFALTADNQGDLQVSRGVNNLKQALIMQLMTPRGTLLLHPQYGSNIHNLFGKATAQNAIVIENEILATLKQDSRVGSVQAVNSTISRDTYIGEFIVEIPTLGESFQLLVENDTFGNLRAR